MIGWALRQLAIWGGLALLLFVSAGHFLPSGPRDPAPVGDAAAPPQAARGVVPNSLVFHANPQGHVFVDAVVNGARVHFLVDTGATFVALTMHDAEAAGIGHGGLAFSGRTSTANGVARVAPVELREVRVGQFSALDIHAVVAENLGISLLGQSFLNRLDSYEMREGVLTLNWN